MGQQRPGDCPFRKKKKKSHFPGSDKVCRRGTTILQARGGYQGDPKQVVMCACSSKEMFAVQQTAKRVDPQSFLIVLESNEVHGEGFRTVQIGGGQ